jgi:hypothetical protein
MSNPARSDNSIDYKRLTLAAIALLAFIVTYVGFVQPWFMRWGATDAEIAMALPGDSFIPPTTVVSTRAITIHAPAAQVWSWLVQLGQERGGFYSYDWLENLFAAQMHNADRIVPAWQHPQVGDRIFMMANPPPVSMAEIVLIEPARVMVLKGGWTFFLQPVDEQTTRFIVRYASFPVKGNLAGALFYYPIFEPIHFVMESGMMMGIKQRAEMAAKGAAFMPSTDLVATAREVSR